MSQQPFLPRSQYARDVIDTIDACFKTGKIPMLWGEPGTGKTELVHALGATRGQHVEVFIGAAADPTDVTGLPMLTSDDSDNALTRTTTPEMFQRVIEADGEGGSILFWDELSSSPSSVQAAELTIMQSRILPNGKRLPDSVNMIAAANPEDVAANGWTLAPPLANRLCHIEWKPPIDDWFDGMVVAWGKEVGEKELTERAKIVAYLRSFPDQVQSMPEGELEAGLAWPSRRTWDNAARTLGSADLGSSARLLLLKGWVGEAVAVQYAAFEKELDMPRLEDVLADPESVNWADIDSGFAYAILGMVSGRVTDDTYGQATEVFITAGTKGPLDIAAALVPSLLTRTPKGHKFPAEMAKVFRDSHKLAGIL